jgi:hypothetical protein
VLGWLVFRAGQIFKSGPLPTGLTGQVLGHVLLFTFNFVGRVCRAF